MSRVWPFLMASILGMVAFARSRDVQKTFDLLKTGAALSSSEALRLGEHLKDKPNDEDARIQLLSYYAAPPTDLALVAVKAARAQHILWLIQNDPKEGLGLFHVSTGIYRLHCEGDQLADLDAFKRASEAWVAQIEKKPKDADVRRNGVDFIRFCDPEQAEKILTAAKDKAGLGRLYADAVLGVTGESYAGGDADGSSAAFRTRPFAAKARVLLEQATEKDFLVAAAGTLLGDGAVLWADGKLDWDYTPLGNSVLARARAADPDAMRLLTLPTALPARGERPPATLRIGGNVQAKQLVRKITPRYPAEARQSKISGTVRMTALIGLDGSVIHLHPESGPNELIPASLAAAAQWQYKPTLLNGKPCYVSTLIDINYSIQ